MLAWQGLGAGLSVVVAGLLFKLELERETTTSRVIAGDGLWVKVLTPDKDWSEAAKATNTPLQYPIEIQIQGHALSMGIDPMEALDVLESALGIEGAGRIQGRIDLAHDFTCSAATYDALVCNGSREAVREFWSMRARRQQTNVKWMGGKRRAAGEQAEEQAEVPPGKVTHVGTLTTTLYLGSREGLQLVIYRKDVAFAGSTGPLLHDRWKAAGWDGKSPVGRVELRFSREWIREHWIGQDSGATLKPERAWPLLGGLWRYATDAYRLVSAWERTGKRRDKSTAPLWKLIQHAWDDWRGDVECEAIQPPLDLARLHEVVGRRVTDLTLALPKDQAEAFVKSILEKPEWLEGYRKFESRWRNGAYGIQRIEQDKHPKFGNTGTEAGGCEA